MSKGVRHRGGLEVRGSHLCVNRQERIAAIGEERASDGRGTHRTTREQ